MSESPASNLRPTATNCKLRAVGVAIVIILVPLLLLALPLPPAKGKWGVHKKDWVGIGATILAVASLALYFLRTSVFPRRSLLPLILCGTAMLIVCNVGWNTAFREYVANSEYSREVFRSAMRNLWAPVYVRYDNAIARLDPVTNNYRFATAPFVGLSLLVAAGFFAWVLRRPLEKRWGAGSLAILIMFQVGLILAFALCEPWPGRLASQIGGYEEFSKDLHRFSNLGDLFRNYVMRMPTLEWYGQHYPPGNLILLHIERKTHLFGLTKTVVILATVLSTIFVNFLAVELELTAAAVSLATLLFAASSGVLIFCTVNTTSLILLPTTICLWALLIGLRRGSTLAAIALGLSFFGYMLFSFSAAILGIWMALIVVLCWWNGLIGWRNVIKTALISAAALVCAIEALKLTRHFDLIACFMTAVQGHHAQQGNEGFDDPYRYFLRSTGNILAYFLSTVPLCILMILALFRRSVAVGSVARTIFIATTATIFIAGFSGQFYVETERIWIFFTPMLALAAGDELARRVDHEVRALAHVVFFLVLAISCTQEFFMLHYFA